MCLLARYDRQKRHLNSCKGACVICVIDEADAATSTSLVCKHPDAQNCAVRRKKLVEVQPIGLHDTERDVSSHPSPAGPNASQCYVISGFGRTCAVSAYKKANIYRAQPQFIAMQFEKDSINTVCSGLAGPTMRLMACKSAQRTSGGRFFTYMLDGGPLPGGL